MTDELPTEPVQKFRSKYEQRISKLEETNGALCAEINRQEKRIEELESFARDMFGEWCATVDDYYSDTIDKYLKRMKALGLIGGDA